MILSIYVQQFSPFHFLRVYFDNLGKLYLNMIYTRMLNVFEKMCRIKSS